MAGHRLGRRGRGTRKSADFDFVESYYRAMLSGGGHVVDVLTTSDDGTGRDDAQPPSHHVLYARRHGRYLSYAYEIADGLYATKYAHTSYTLSNDERLYRTEYCFAQDGQRLQLFQTLNGTVSTGTLLFESVMPYTMVPTMMIEHDSRVVLCLNALHGDTKAAVAGKRDERDDGMAPLYTGYIYVISIDLLDGQWHPLFESDRQLRYSVHDAVGRDGRVGIMIANICDDRRGALPMPSTFRDIPRYVMEESPHEGPSMNVPYGVSVYSPESSSFTLLPIGGNQNWNVDGIEIRDDDGVARAMRDDGNDTMRMNALRVMPSPRPNASPETTACNGSGMTLDSDRGQGV